MYLNTPSNFSSSDIDFMFTNRYYTHVNTLHTPRHQDNTKQRVQPLKKKKLGTEGVLKRFASVRKGKFKAGVLQCGKYDDVIRFALPKSQPRLYNVQSRVIALRVPCRTNRTTFMHKQPKLHSGHRHTSAAGANTGIYIS